MSKLTITEFLEARIAEDEKLARAVEATVAPDEWENPTRWGNFYPEDIAFYDVHTPARVLAECAAKRAILEEHYWRSAEGARGCGLCNYNRDYGWEETGPCKTVRALAAVYASHPDYQQWAL